MNKREEKRLANINRKNELIEQRDKLLQELKDIAAKNKQTYDDLWNAKTKEEKDVIFQLQINYIYQSSAIKRQLRPLNYEIKVLTNRGY